MNRREALKAGFALSLNGRTAMRAFSTESGAKYIMFYNPKMFGPKSVEQFMADYPGSTAYPVEGNLDNAIRLFQDK